MFRLSILRCCCRGSNPSPTVIAYHVGVHRSDDCSMTAAYLVSTCHEQSIRFSRGAPRCSCSRSLRRYSCSSKRHPRSHSHCCSSDPGRDPRDFPPFTPDVTARRFRITLCRAAFSCRSALRFSDHIFFVFKFSEEAEARPAVRARAR